MTTVISGTSGFIADFSNATVASRQAFQTSTSNGSTGIYALPNGTSTAASWQATNAADPTNASKILIATNGSTDVQLVSGRNGTGTYLPLTFYTNGSQQMILNTSGYLGVGETSPASPIHITSATAPTSGSMLRLDNSATTNYSASSYVGGQIRINYTNASTRYGGINFSNFGATSQEFFGVVQNGGGYGDFVFQGYNGSSYSERARIDSNSNMYIGSNAALSGTAGSSAGLTVVSGTIRVGLFDNTDGAIWSTFSATRTIGMCAGGSGNYTGGASQAWMKFTPGASANITAMSNTNGVTLALNATAWSAASDPRLKNVTGTYTQALQDIAQIRSIKFTWKSDSTNTPQVGVDASTVQQVVPEAIHEDILAGQTEDQTKYLSVRYTELIPILIASVQELKAIVDAQAIEIAALKA